ncbi:LysR family transcriptional regulator [Feifania hominis]|uniref:LysR family transcriptional regulator n=1 Tax=Feifania hominis TaxID=2763660 RepID=A0A926HU28_9FIRM|nr:LysR family transcriptional regulator [Feifania hominis]MBC8535101.1 LysR family transcriptional regulator [Feifania hominis]
MPVNFEYYRIFYHVAKYKNLTQAAAALMSSQPNITRVINILERELGCRLFIRSNRGVRLTAEGEQLYSRVAAACEQLQLGEAELAQSMSLESGTVRIGASETALHGLLLGVLREFHEQYPNVRLKINNYSTPQALNALRSGQIDFAVVTTPTGAAEGMRQISLKPFQDSLIAGEKFAALSGRTLHLSELSQYPLIMLAQDTGTFAFYNRFYLDHGVVLEPDMEAATSDLILPMIRNNLGIGFLPREFATRALAEGEVFELKLYERIPQRSICLVLDTHRAIGAAGRRLQEMLSAARA